MPGRSPRQKGDRLERFIVNELRAAGIDAYRVPLSGAMRGFKGDIHIKSSTRNLTMEAKSRKAGFKFIYDSLGDNDLLCVRVDRDDPLVIMPLSTFTEVLSTKERTNPPASTSSDNPLQQPIDDPVTVIKTFAAKPEWMVDLGYPIVFVNGDGDDGVLGDPSPDVSRETKPGRS